MVMWHLGRISKREGVAFIPSDELRKFKICRTKGVDTAEGR